MVKASGNQPPRAEQLALQIQDMVDAFDVCKIQLAASLIEALKGFAETIKSSCPKKTVSATTYITGFFEAYEIAPRVFYSDASEFGLLLFAPPYPILRDAVFVVKLGSSPEDDLENLPRVIRRIFEKYFPDSRPPAFTPLFVPPN